MPTFYWTKFKKREKKIFVCFWFGNQLERNFEQYTSSASCSCITFLLHGSHQFVWFSQWAFYVLWFRAKQYWLWTNQNIHSNIDLDLSVRARKRWRMSEIVNEHRRINRFWYSTWSHVDCSPICSFSYWRETACEYRGLMLNRKFWHANPIGHSALIDKLANVTFVFRLFMIRSLDGLVVSFILYIFDITSLINEYSTWFLSDISWNITRSIKYLWKIFLVFVCVPFGQMGKKMCNTNNNQKENNKSNKEHIKCVKCFENHLAVCADCKALR